MLACTNKRIMQEVLDVGPSIFSWSDSVESESAKEVVYTLTLVEQFLVNQYEEEESSDKVNTWVDRFLRQGGLGQLMAMLDKIIAQLRQAKRDKAEPSIIVKQIVVLSSIIRIISIFTTTTVCTMR